MEHRRLRRTIHIGLAITICSIAFIGSKASADTTSDPDLAAAPPGPAAPATSVHHYPIGGPVRPARIHASYTAGALTYHGGPVMRTTRVHLFFWDPSGTSFPAAYTNGIVRYFRDLIAVQPARRNVYSVARQYGAKYQMTEPALCLVHTSKCAKAWIIRDAYPNFGSGDCTVNAGWSACLTQTDMTNELEHIRTSELHFGTGTTDISFVFLPPNVDTCDPACFSTPAFCAYHSAYASGTSGVVWANMPYVPGSACDINEYPNGSVATTPADGEYSVISHEHNEAMTDPLPGSGWFNGDTAHENGDQCAYVFDQANTIGFGVSPGTGPLSGTPGHYWDQKINHHKYLLQEEWSNSFFAASGNTVGCLQHG